MYRLDGPFNSSISFVSIMMFLKFLTDIHKFVRKILNDESYTSIEPTFFRQDAETYLTEVYSALPRDFTRPPWMPEAPSCSHSCVGHQCPHHRGGCQGVVQVLISIVSQPCGPDTLPGTKEVSSRDSGPASSIQLLLGTEEGAGSLEGWYAETAGEEEGCGGPQATQELSPHCLSLMCLLH